MKKLSFKGAILLIISVLIISCSKDDNPSEENSTTVNAADYLYYISGKLNGEPFVYGFKANATTLEYTATVGKSGGCSIDNSDYSGVNYNAGVNPDFDSSLPSIDFEFIRFYLCSNMQSSSEVFNDMFPVKSYSLATNNDNITGSTGDVGISYSPNIQENLYYTSYGGVQSGQFIITSSIEANVYLLDVLVSTNQQIEGSFSVKLYNANDSSDVIEITDGKFKIDLSH